VAYFIDTPRRLGRSQGATLFWGLISVCFAAGACFYYYKSTENQRQSERWHDQVMQLQDQIETLKGEKSHMQDGLVEQETQVKAREDLVQEKESELAAAELQVEAMGRQNATIAAQNQAQVAMVKKFNEVIRALDGTTPPDVVERSGRPVLRVPNTQLFAPGETTLTPEGKTLLTQMAQGVAGQMDTFELRVVCYTDTDAEAPTGTPRNGDDPHGAAWALTAARATALSRFFRDETQLPILNVLVTARGDAEPIAPNAGEERVRNRRVEIAVTPLPVPFHAPDADKAAAGDTTGAATGTTTPAKKKAPKTADKTPPQAKPATP
jgi:flagellar motor protein MotB